MPFVNKTMKLFSDGYFTKQTYVKSNKYLEKDIEKFNYCTHLIAHGSKGSSSYAYANGSLPLPHLILDGTNITPESIVGLSTNGNRPDRTKFPIGVLELLHSIGCRIVTDNNYRRQREYNIGERELAEYLQQHYDYTDYTTMGLWTPRV